jgi:WD40 repeat protein
MVSTLIDSSGDLRFAISPDNHYIASGGWEGIATLWETLSGRKVHTISMGKMNPILRMAFSPDSKYLLIVHGLSGSLLDAKTGLKVHENLANKSDYPHAEFSPDGKRFLIDRGIWDTETGQPIQKLDQLVNPIVDPTGNSLLFSPDGKYVFEEGANPALLADARNFAPVRTLEGTYREDDFKFWEFSPNGKYLAATEAQEAALIWDVETGKKLHRFELSDPQPEVLFFLDGRRILLAEISQSANWNDPRARYTIYDLAAKKELKKIVLPIEYPTHFITTPDNKYLLTLDNLPASSSTPAALQIWDVETGKLVGEYC